MGLSQLGNEVGFIGKVNNDNLGKKYLEGLEKEKVKFHNNIKDEKIRTGTCLILITPDSERTMCTFLGIAGKISEEQMYYLATRGFSEDDAMNLVVNGFCKDVFQKLPLEFAAEANQLLAVQLEGAVG